MGIGLKNQDYEQDYDYELSWTKATFVWTAVARHRFAFTPGNPSRSG